ncbi:DNA repair protein RecN [Ruminococcaceae bacterium OttesenSCG-928-D13]|nr:DNA repair protein RecN [Ruminococcaceae bacterium OttesenSCG-928-D13]
MLSEITIENVAVIERARVDFTGGFTVLTGETGAGKSILIDSINAILGNRTSRDIVRSGAQKAGIWATFTEVAPGVLEKLAEAGYPCDGELLLYREVTADGKSTCRINGMPATAAILRDICGSLVNIHGQHDNQSLLNPAKHIDLLDAYAANSALLGSYGAAYGKMTELQRSIASLSTSEADKTRRIDLLKYELEEIEGALLTPDEEEKLEEQRSLIVHAQRILEGMNTSYLALSGGDDDTGAATLLSTAAAAMTDAAAYAPELSAFAESLNEIYYTVSEMSSDIQNRITGFDFDDRSLDGIEARLDLIYKLKQKYGPSLEDVLAYGAKARQELENIEFSEERLLALEKELAQSREQVEALAAELTARRREAFDRLNSKITETLAFLNMPGIAMALDLQAVAPGPIGCDQLEFYISTNPGEKPKPLAKIASGGELARIMLAVKSALADKDDVATVIYDEIDTGISGLAAGRIGQVLRNTAKGRQVICVTHTAQVTAYAGRHLLIEKQVEDGRTYTHISELDHDQRIAEMARIISGDHVTDLAKANASEMLELAARA